MNNNDKPEKQLTEKRKIGNLGEDIACIYLEKQVFRIIDRNYLRKYGEIDIVAEKQGIMHFIEVKTVSRVTSGQSVTRVTKDQYRAEDNVHPWKLQRLRRVIQAYILDKKIRGDWQFDVVTVVLNMKTRRASIEMMDNIVL